MNWKIVRAYLAVLELLLQLQDALLHLLAREGLVELGRIDADGEQADRNHIVAVDDLVGRRLQTEDARAALGEVARIVEGVETEEVGLQERLEDVAANGQLLVDLAARERNVWRG